MAQSGRASKQAGAACFIAGFEALSTLTEVDPACSSANAAVAVINRAATRDFPDRLMHFTASAPSLEDSVGSHRAGAAGVGLGAMAGAADEAAVVGDGVGGTTDSSDSGL